jgi:hypothetical protein
MSPLFERLWDKTRIRRDMSVLQAQGEHGKTWKLLAIGSVPTNSSANTWCCEINLIGWRECMRIDASKDG